MFTRRRVIKPWARLLLWFAIGCSLAIANPSAADIYMYSSQTWMMFLRFSARERDFLGGNVIGDFESAALDDRCPDGLHVFRSGVSGAIRGGTFRIDLGGASLFGASEFYGAYTANRLSLKIPATSGRIESLVFTRAGEAQWNSRLERLREVARWRKYAVDLDRAFEEARNDAFNARQQIKTCQSRFQADSSQWERALRASSRQQQRLAEAKRERSEAGDKLQAAVELAAAARKVAERCRSASEVTTVRQAEAGIKEAAGLVDQAAAQIEALASDIESGHSGGGYLGIAMSPANQVLSDDLKSFYGVNDGALVESVIPGTSADRGGLMSEDVITSFDGHPIRSFNDLATVLASTLPEKQVRVELVRAHHPMSLTLTLGGHLETAQQMLDQANKVVTRQLGSLESPHDPPSDDAAREVSQAASDASYEASQVDYTRSKVSYAVSQVDYAISQVNYDLQQADSHQREAASEVAQDSAALGQWKQRLAQDQTTVRAAQRAIPLAAKRWRSAQQQYSPGILRASAHRRAPKHVRIATRVRRPAAQTTVVIRERGKHFHSHRR